MESSVCRDDIVRHCRLGADEVIGLLSGKDRANALTVGHYDASGRHQPWGVVFCTKRDGEAWSAAGHAYASSFDWIVNHHHVLKSMFGNEWPFDTSQGTSANVSLYSGPIHRQHGKFGSFETTVAFPRVHSKSDAMRAFGQDKGGALRFEMVRDGGTAIDSLFETWPEIFKGQRSVMCHHHEAPLTKKKAREIIRSFIQAPRHMRDRKAKAGNRIGPLPKSVQLYWDKELARSKNEKNGDRIHYYDDFWHTYFNRMYDAVCHTPCPKRSDALLRLLCSAMVDIGFGELARFLYERYGAGSHTLGKLRRSEMVVPRGPMANAGCEGGTNKRVKKYIGMSMGIGRVIEETVPWIVSEGKNEWNRPGALKMPDVTNSGNTENNNTWKKRRGADSSYAWRDARRLITNYFDDAGKRQGRWLGVHQEGKDGVKVVASQEVRDFCYRKGFRELKQDADETEHPTLALQALLGSDRHLELVQQQHKDVFKCWQSYRKEPDAFLEKIKLDCFARTEPESKDYWANDNVVKTNRVTDWLEIFHEALFYEFAFCRCVRVPVAVTEAEKKILMPERWRIKDVMDTPINFLTYRCDCLMFQMHGYCGSVIACGLHAGDFKVPSTKNGTPMRGKLETDLKNRRNMTPDKDKSQFWFPTRGNKRGRLY